MKVLDGNQKAAVLLANAVHSSGTDHFDEHLVKLLKENVNIELNIDNIGIWIDPIGSSLQLIISSKVIFYKFYSQKFFRFDLRVREWRLGNIRQRQRGHYNNWIEMCYVSYRCLRQY